MTLPPRDSLECLTHADLIGVVRDLIGEATRMRAENEKLGGALAKLRGEHRAVKDELAHFLVCWRLGASFAGAGPERAEGPLPIPCSSLAKRRYGVRSAIRAWLWTP
jgi:hypothetical protein